MKRIFSSLAVLAALVVLLLTPAGTQAQSTVKNYFANCQGVNCNNTFNVGGTMAVASTATVTGLVSAPSNATYKIARGASALDGANPTPITTGLTTIVTCTTSIKRTSAVTSGSSFVTEDYTGSDGIVQLYGWVLAGTASAGTETIDWVCVGT